MAYSRKAGTIPSVFLSVCEIERVLLPRHHNVTTCFRYTNIFTTKFCLHTLGQSGQRKSCRDLRQQVRHCKLAGDRRTFTMAPELKKLPRDALRRTIQPSPAHDPLIPWREITRYHSTLLLRVRHICVSLVKWSLRLCFNNSV